MAPTISRNLDQLVQELARANNDLLPRGGTATAASSTTTAVTIGGEIGSLPAGSLKGSQLYTNGESSPQSLRLTDHTVSSGTATLTYNTATDPGDVTFYLVNLGGRGFTRQQYVDAINFAIDSAAQRTFTDTSSVSFAIERGAGSTLPRGTRRYEYPIPSGYLYLWGVDVLRADPMEYHGTGYWNVQRAFGDDATRTRVGQGFQLDQQARVAYIAVLMGKVGAPTDNLTCVVETNSSGIPSGTAAATVTADATSDTVAGTGLETRMRWVVFSFTPPILLQEATTYHLTLRRSGSADAAAYYVVAEDDGNNYSGGTMSIRNATTWTALDGTSGNNNSDLCFAISEQADWLTLAKSLWEYRPASTDSLLIRGNWHEGKVVQLRGGAAIARPSTDATEVPLDPDWVLNAAQVYLRGSRTGLVTAENNGAGAGAAGQRLGMVQMPTRPFPANAVRIR